MSIIAKIINNKGIVIPIMIPVMLSSEMPEDTFLHNIIKLQCVCFKCIYPKETNFIGSGIPSKHSNDKVLFVSVNPLRWKYFQLPSFIHLLGQSDNAGGLHPVKLTNGGSVSSGLFW